MVKRKSKSAYQQITSKLGQLTRSELDDLIEVAMVLREAIDQSLIYNTKNFLRWRAQSTRRAQAEEGPC